MRGLRVRRPRTTFNKTSKRFKGGTNGSITTATSVRGRRQRLYPWLLLFPDSASTCSSGSGRPWPRPSTRSPMRPASVASRSTGSAGTTTTSSSSQERRSRDNSRRASTNPHLHGPGDHDPVRPRPLMALLVNQKLRGRMVFRTLFFVPVILGVAVQGLMWKLFLRPGGGPMHEIFSLFGSNRSSSAAQTRSTGSSSCRSGPTPGSRWSSSWPGCRPSPPTLRGGFGRWGLGLAAVQERHLASTHARGQHQLPLEHRRLAPGVDAVPRAHRLQERHQCARVRRVRRGVRPDRASSFRQGYAAAASIVLFLLVLVLGMAANAVSDDVKGSTCHDRDHLNPDRRGPPRTTAERSAVRDRKVGSYAICCSSRRSMWARWSSSSSRR